jgi:hypothetical protein
MKSASLINRNVAISVALRGGDERFHRRRCQAHVRAILAMIWSKPLGVTTWFLTG